ncbi:XrtA/PEP-CTERM system histidine kinase PrsK [Pelomonas sp. SE-A7]|uniref:XrtA/PEP-CTERM system histidine kinase PrsK n=1 Tax=Pelomonas sp. SE-A7 TaxID=3054953 RepID=UPI00259CB23D|nr:XrtA/PEP-CTERM system histidine kinase PrsK [Pelomonas sp. SE-A7]MDM4764859.1 PEP-CTERM system histidine kinase PrsK [Pelomonas sp. SE-A7]
MLNLAAASDLLAALSYGAFALVVATMLVRPREPEAIGLTGRLLAALTASLVWALLSFYFRGPGSPRLGSVLLPLADATRYGLLFLFILGLLVIPGRAEPGRLRIWACLTSLSLPALLLLRELLGYQPLAFQQQMAFASLAMAVCGLVLVEQLLRNSRTDARWNAKPVCLGLSAIFVFDLFIYSQAALFQRFDSDALDIRAAAHAVAVPLLYLAARRDQNWLGKLHVSRAAVFHSATLLLVGVYLLLVSAVGYYVRYTGGDWGRALQVALVFVALVMLAMLLLSGALRSKLRVYISKNFFSYRYDYREEWLRFTAMLSATTPEEMGESVVRALADLVESPAGALWLPRSDRGDWRQALSWNLPEQHQPEGAESKLCAYLRERAWIIDLDEFRRGSTSYQGLVLPEWLVADVRYWLVVPLLAAGQLTGFVVLGRPRTQVELNWEVRDLLKTAGSQAATFLAQMQATEALLESRKFDAFNKMSAFVVHDLKNIITQLSLMMKNAKRLRDNPEFQQDMLDTVENSLEKMRQLMLQLREGASPHGVAGGVDLSAIAGRLAAAAAGKGRELELRVQAGVSTRGHEERVERVIGHMVQNAFDATPVQGRVWLTLEASGSNARVEVGDTGCGMTRDFIENKLFKPFSTTKSSGMGIGAYESYQYLQELGGKIDVASEPGRGTRITLLLPLFHASAASDLGLMNAR